MQDPIVWDVSREIVSLGPLTLRWYGLLFMLGFVVGYYIVQQIYRQEKKPLGDLDTLLLFLMGGTIIGARLGHVLFYDPGYYLLNPVEILKIWKGGLASHGGVIGVILALYYFSKKRPSQPFFWLMDRIAIPTALAGCFIRLGNLFNSEILGRPTDVAWGFAFPNAQGLTPAEAMVPRHPAQLYESLAYLVIFGILMAVYRRKRDKTPHGFIVGLALVLVFTARFFIEYVKLPQADFAVEWAVSMGQLLSIPAVLIGGFLMWRAKRQP